VKEQGFVIPRALDGSVPTLYFCSEKCRQQFRENK
jgi:hypothetical protein